MGERAPASVRVACEGRCGQTVPEDGDLDPRTEVTAALAGTTAGVSVDMTTPGSAVVTVLAADGSALAEVGRDLGCIRVGGSAECGGPMRATVAVPAP